MHLDMFGVILYFFLSSLIGHILYFVIERLINYPILTPLRQLGFEHLIREDFSSTSEGRRTAFAINITAIPVLFFHTTATIIFPWYALGFAIAGLFTTWRMTFLTMMYGRARDQVIKAHAWLDSCRVYAFVLAVGICTMSTINRMNPFSNWTIKINRASAETYGIMTIFGIAAGIYYLAKKFYVKNPDNKLVPHSGKQSRNQAAINLGLMVLSFVAFSDFRIWKQFSDWMRLQGYASSVFGFSADSSCKNYSEKKKPKGCSSTEFGPSLCHGCCATEAEALAASKLSVVKFDEESIMANPPSYFPILAKQVIRNPKEIPDWFTKLPKYLQQAIFDGYYDSRNIQDRNKPKLLLETFLAKRFYVKYLSGSNVWTLMPLKLDSPQTDSDSESFDDIKTPESVPHCGNISALVDAGIEIDMQDIPQVNLEDEFPLLKKVPKVLTTKVGFLVAMALLAYGIYLYNRKEEPSEDKYVPPSRRVREEEHKLPSSLYQRPTGREEHRGKVTFRQQNTKQEKITDRQRRGYVNDSNTSDEENSPERWYKRFKAALSKYYVLYDSNDLESILKDGGITMFGVGGNAEVQMVVARNLLEFNNYTARGYYCDPTIMRPISKGRVIFTNDAKGVDVDTSILQDIARGKPVRANAMQKLSELLQDEDIILDASAQSLVDSYHRIDANWFGPRNPDTQTPNVPFSRKGKPENADIKPTATKDKPPVILKRPTGLNNKLEEMTGKTLDRTCCTDERLCSSCTDKLSYRKAALATATPPVITDLMDAALNDFGESASVPEAWWLPRISSQGSLGPDAPNGCVHYCGKATSDSTACCDFDCGGEQCSHWVECDVWKIKAKATPESSTATASEDKTCPFDGRIPGCRQIDCRLEHPTRQPVPEALNGYHFVSHFPEKLTTNFLAFINLRNPNDGSLVKYGTCYVTHSHLSTASHVFKTRDGQNIPLEHLSVQFPGSETQFAIAPGTIHSIPFSLELDPPYAGEQVRFKLVENDILSTKTTAPIGVPVVGETIYILTVRGKENSPWPVESKIETIENGLMKFSSNTQKGDSGGPVVSARTGNVIGTYWGLSTDPKLNLAIANCTEQLPFYASGQILKQNFSHPSLRVTSQWRGTF